MELSNAKKKHYRTIGHNLKPVVMIADKGVTEAIGLEIERALEDHELIKIKINVNDPGARKQMAEQLCTQHKATLVQSIGKMLVMVRAAKKPNPKLSNLLRPS